MDLLAEPSKGKDKWNILKRGNENNWEEVEQVDAIEIDDSKAQMRYGKIFLNSEHCDLDEKDGVKVFKCSSSNLGEKVEK